MPVTVSHSMSRCVPLVRRAAFVFACCFAVLLQVRDRVAFAAEPPNVPNIVFILADDLGYGDPQCFHPQSKCVTPNMDRLARDGMRFTDAHAAGSFCVPSRYGLLTGRYPFRAASMDPSQQALIEPGRMTIASLLRKQGYATTMIGKWHLGFDGGDDFDYSQPLRGGPLDHGFDTFFGQHASLDIPPYFYIHNDRCVVPPTEHIDASNSADWSPIQGAFWRAGGIASDFKMDDVLKTYTKQAVTFIESRGRAVEKKPFFLYLALTAPHTPWLPSEEFRNRAGANLYTAWVAEVDDALGQVLAALDRGGESDKTLVVFTSDNGPTWYPEDVKKYGHSATARWRGMKGDWWEGGHRVPFVVRWPGKVAAGSTSEQLVNFTDMLATFAELTGGRLPREAGEDSFSFLSALLDRPASTPLRDELAIGWGEGALGIRQGDWKLVPFLGSGGFSTPSRIPPEPGQPAGQLYNLATDPGETENLYSAKPDVVQRLTLRATEIREQGRSRPGSPQ